MWWIASSITSSSQRSPRYWIRCRCCWSLWHCCTATDTTSMLNGHRTSSTHNWHKLNKWLFQLGTVIRLHAYKEEQFFSGVVQFTVFWNICSRGTHFKGLRSKFNVTHPLPPSFLPFLKKNKRNKSKKVSEQKQAHVGMEPSLTSQTRWDGVKVLWCHSRLVWLVF